MITQYCICFDYNLCIIDIQYASEKKLKDAENADLPKLPASNVLFKRGLQSLPLKVSFINLQILTIFIDDNITGSRNIRRSSSIIT